MIAIANVSGFYGDRLAAAREIVDAHQQGRVHVDVLTGDWLAELTMGLLAKQRERGAGGWATTFVRQMRDVLADCLDAGILVVANAGGLDPAGCAAEIAAIDERARVAWVGGDDVTEQVRALPPERTAHLDTGEPLPDAPVVANAYLGCRGIVAALEAGANVVVTGRVTDAAVVVGPAAWHHGWGVDDLDALAGAVAAGHVIECGAQATGGNFSFAAELDGTEHVGLPVAEIEADGSAVITKAAGTGGAVTVETVTAQLLYEVDGPRYLTPDVVARLDTITLHAGSPRPRPPRRHPRRTAARHRQGRRRRARRVAQRDDVRAHRPGRRGEGRARARRPVGRGAGGPQGVRPRRDPSAARRPARPRAHDRGGLPAHRGRRGVQGGRRAAVPGGRRDRARGLPRLLRHRPARPRQRRERVLADPAAGRRPAPARRPRRPDVDGAPARRRGERTGSSGA